MAVARAFALAWALFAALEAGADPSPVEVDYLAAVKQELARLSIDATCDGASRTCVFSRVLPTSGRVVEVVARVGPDTQTVYLGIERFIELADPAGPDVALARTLLGLNRRLVTSKLEWDPGTGCVGISTVLSTDSNFDRKAFRSQLLGLLTSADRIQGMLASKTAATTDSTGAI